MFLSLSNASSGAISRLRKFYLVAFIEYQLKNKVKICLLLGSMDLFIFR